MGKLGLDGHDLGLRITCHFLREAGMEVIYLGLHNTADGIVNIAIQEDVDVIGLSFLSGNYFIHTQQVVDTLRQKGRADIPVVLGGVIPRSDFDELKKIGAREVYEGGWPIERIIGSLNEIIKEKRKG